MAARRLHRVYGFVVGPLQEEEEWDPVGGAIQMNGDLEALLGDNLGTLESEGFMVDLQLDTSTRTSDVRTLLQEYSFGNTKTPSSAAERIAERLARAMDGRSNECLLILAMFDSGSERQVALWTFPKEDAFQFRKTSGAAQLDLLRDLFNHHSKLRKGASFKGSSINGANDFIRGKVLDYQAKSSLKAVAAFWMGDFLDARYAMTPQVGSRLLARHLKAMTEGSPDEPTLDQVFAAAFAIATRPPKPITFREVADTFFDDALHDVFFRGFPSDTIDSPFTVSKEVFKEGVSLAEFVLSNGLDVKVPLTRLKTDVKVQGDQVTVTGKVKTRRLRAR